MEVHHGRQSGCTIIFSGSPDDFFVFNLPNRQSQPSPTVDFLSIRDFLSHYTRDFPSHVSKQQKSVRFFVNP
jgi:hypothetical protein